MISTMDFRYSISFVKINPLRHCPCLSIGNYNAKPSNILEISAVKARFFLLVDLRDFFSDPGSGDEKKLIKKL